MPAPRIPRPPTRTLVAVGVVLLHAMALWALQSGLLMRTVEMIVPVTILSDIAEPPEVRPTPPSPAPRSVPAPLKPTTAMAPPPAVPMATLQPVPTTEAIATANAPTSVITPQSAPPSPLPAYQPPAPVATAGATTPSPPAVPKIELPSSDADYLQNPKPAFPAISKKLREQGQVIHSVLIGADGLPISATLVKTSGFERLDQAAYVAVMRWRYVPGKRNGVATTMAFNVPINWVLE